MKRILTIILLMLTICSCEAGKILKTNTAVILAVGPFVDFSDGVTPETAMTVTNITMELFKETDEGSAPTRAIGVNPTASGGSNDMVHITSDVAGFYSIELTASNVNFLGRATLVFTDPDVCLPVFVPITVVSDQVFSSLIEDDDELQVHTAEITGDLITASVIAADAIGSSELAANSITSSEIADDSIDAGAIAADAIGASELGADSIASSELATTAVTEITSGLATEANVDANESKIDTLTTNVGTVDTVVDGIKAKTDNLTFTTANKVDSRIDYVGSNAVTTPNDFKATGFSTLTAANLASATEEVAARVWAVSGRELTNPTAAEFDIVSASVNGLEGSSAPSAATIADAVWDEATSGHVASGSFGNLVDWLRDVAEADIVMSTATTPWNRVLYIKDTATELVRKRLYTDTSTAITDKNTAVMKELESAP